MVEAALSNIRIILVEPAGPLNIGSIARVMKNMGLSRLVLVNPQCDLLDAAARQMAVHAVDVLEAAQVVKTLPEALWNCQRAIATTARSRSLANLEHPKTALPWLLESEFSRSSALIFGPEDRGLSNVELNYAQRFVGIPSNPDYPSLNLAQAVAICCYELYQHVREKFEANQDSVADISSETRAERASNFLAAAAQTSSNPPAPLDVLENYYLHLENVLLQIGYLYPHTAASRMQKFRRLFNRALPSTEEVSLLRGILSQVEWAINRSAPCSDDAVDRHE